MNTRLSSNRTVYLIDPDEVIGEALATLLATYNINVQTFPDAETFLSDLTERDNEICCLLVELNLPGICGVALLRKLRAMDFRPPVIILTSAASPDLRQQAKQFGAIDVIEKPLIEEFLLGRLSQLISDGPQRANASSSSVELRDGSRITIRVMRPEDAEIEQDFVRKLSARSKHLRFFSGLNQLSPRMLEQFTNPEFPESYALLATVSDGEQEQEIGVARYAPTDCDGVAEFAVVVADEWQGLGVASVLLRGIIVAATVAGNERLDGLVLRENQRMMRLAKGLGFRTSSLPNDDPAVVRVSKVLRSSARNPNSQQQAEVGILAK